MSEIVISVAGMTCEHCVTAVKQEIGNLPGVASVDVALESGKVRVFADPAPDHEALKAAVDAAGYELRA